MILRHSVLIGNCGKGVIPCPGCGMLMPQGSSKPIRVCTECYVSMLEGIASRIDHTYDAKVDQPFSRLYAVLSRLWGPW